MQVIGPAPREQVEQVAPFEGGDEAGRGRRTDPLAPVGLGNEIVYGFVTGLLAIALRSLFKVKVADAWPLPEGPLILAPNHRSYLDPAIVGSLLTRRPVFMMHAKYYDMPQLNWLYRVARCIPVESGPDNRRALREGKRVLDAGLPLVIFPEGTISPDGFPQPPQPGMAWLARISGAPVLPVHIGGSREALRKGSYRLRFRPMTVRIGSPRWRHEFRAGRQGDEAFSAAIMADIAALDPEVAHARGV